jgi:hypothetical protein
LLLTLALAACDPVSRTFTAVLQVASDGEALYAYSVESRSWGPGCCGYGDILYFESRDGGLTWQETLTPPMQMQQKLERAGRRLGQTCDPEYINQCTRVDGLGRAWRSTDGGTFWYSTPTYYLFEDIDGDFAFKSLDYRKQCSSVNPQLCFRLSRQGQIESSMDGGQSWAIDWQLPAGRVEYLERAYARYRPGVPDGFRPLDLAVLDTPQGTIVAAAMGSQGVLVRTLEGSWEPRLVGTASPLSDRAQNIGQALLAVLPEAGRALLFSALLAALIAAAASFTIDRLFRQRGRSLAAPWMPNLRRLLLLYALLLFAVLLLPYLLWTFGAFSGTPEAGLLSLVLALLVAVLGLAHTLLSLHSFSRQTAG